MLIVELSDRLSAAGSDMGKAGMYACAGTQAAPSHAMARTGERRAAISDAAERPLAGLLTSGMLRDGPLVVEHMAAPLSTRD